MKFNSIPQSPVGVIRHLDDEDDLTKPGRDSNLLCGQECKVDKIVGELFSADEIAKMRLVVIVSSPKMRTRQTSNMLSESLKNVKPTVKVRFAEDESLKAIYEGEYILPNDYQPGNYFEGLPVAQKIFNREVHGSDYGGADNVTYRFGDPVKQSDGSYKYPELLNYYSSPGESYRDVLVRIYKMVIDSMPLVKRSGDGMHVVVVTHGQVSQILKDLVKLKKMGYSAVPLGGIAEMCWEMYKRREDSEKVTGSSDLLPVDALFDEESVARLINEVKYLESL